MPTPADIPARPPAVAALDVDAASAVAPDDLRDAVGEVDDPAPTDRGELPWEADPADVAEQDTPVPFDDEER